MTEHMQIGTVEILLRRVYALDASRGLDGGGRTVVVEPGKYPVYRAGMATY
jgi:hypothetical protein